MIMPSVRRWLLVMQDKVTASKLPNSWNLNNIFIVGIVYGLYLTFSSWLLFYVATHTSFFSDKIGMHDLRYAPSSVLRDYCVTTGIPLSGVQVRLIIARLVNIS